MSTALSSGRRAHDSIQLVAAMFSFIKAAVAGRGGTISQKYKFEISNIQMVYLTAPLGDLKVEFIRGPRTVTTDFCAPDEKSFGCKYTNSFAQQAPLALLCTMYRDEKTGVHQPKQGKLAVTLRIGKVEKSFAKLDFDLAPYASQMENSHIVSMPFTKCGDKNAKISFTLKSTWMKQLDGTDDDAMSSISDLSTLQTAHDDIAEPVQPVQRAKASSPAPNDVANLNDLKDFEIDEEHSKQSEERIRKLQAELDVANSKLERAKTTNDTLSADKDRLSALLESAERRIATAAADGVESAELEHVREQLALAEDSAQAQSNELTRANERADRLKIAVDEMRSERDGAVAESQKIAAKTREMELALQAAAKVYAMVKDLQAEKEESLKVISVLQKNAQIERQKAEAAAGVAKKAIEGLKTELEQAIEARIASTDALNALQSQLNTLQSNQSEKLAESNSQTNQTDSDLQSQLIAMESSHATALSELKSQLENSVSLVAQRDKTVADLKNQLKEMQEQHQTQCTEFSDKIADSAAETVKLQTALATLQQQSSDSSSQQSLALSSLQAELTSAQQNSTELKTRIEALSRELELSRSDLDASKAEAEQSKAAAEQIQSQCDELRASAESLKSKLSVTEAQRDTEAASVVEKSENIRQLNSALLDVRAQLSLATEAAQNDRTAIGRLTEELQFTRAELSTMTLMQRANDDSKATLNRDLEKSREERVERAEQEVTSLQAALETVRSSLAASERQLQSQTAEHATAVAALQKSLDDVKFDIGLKVADAMANLETANNNVKIARDETAKLSEQCRSIENERRLAVESHEKAIQALTVSHESSIAQLLTQHQQALVALQSKHEVDVAEAVQAALQLEHSKFQVEAQNAEKKLRDEFSQQSSAMQEQHQVEMRTALDEAEELIRIAETRASSLQTQVNDLKQSVANQNSPDREIERLHQQLSLRETDITNVTALQQQQKQIITQLQQRVASLTEECERAEKSEQDSRDKASMDAESASAQLQMLQRELDRRAQLQAEAEKALAVAESTAAECRQEHDQTRTVLAQRESELQAVSMELADARAALSQAKEQLSSQLLSPARQRAATKVASAEPAKSNDSEAMEQLREELAASQRRARSLQESADGLEAELIQTKMELAAAAQARHTAAAVEPAAQTTALVVSQMDCAELDAAEDAPKHLTNQTHREEFFASYGIEADTLAIDEFNTAGRKRSTAVVRASPATASVSGGASSVQVQNAVTEATVALQAKLDRSMRQASKLSVLIAEMEAKYVDRQVKLVDTIDALHTIEAECQDMRAHQEALEASNHKLQEKCTMLENESLEHKIKSDLFAKELDLLKRKK